MARLPTVGGDDGNWGNVLNSFLAISHNSDGTLKNLFINAKDYGVVGDGTTDDTTALQNAVNAAVASGGTLFLPNGKYLCSKITISDSIRVMGQGGWGTADGMGAKIIAKASLNDNLIQFTPAAGKGIVGALFSNLIFDGQGANQTAGDIFYAYGAIQCLWDHCHFTNPWGAGLHISQDGNSGTGHHNRVVNCLFDNGISSNEGDGIGLQIDASDENMILNSDFENNGLGGVHTDRSFHIVDLTGLNSYMNCVFVGPIYSTYGRGIKIQGDNGKIIGCTFDGVGGTENIRLNGNRIIIQGNIFYNVGAHGTADGILPDNISETLIQGNQFNPGGSGRSCVNLTSGTPTNIMILGNNFSTDSGSWSSGAIQLGTGTGHIIKDNKGFNPVGYFTSPAQPAIPASGTAYTNNFGFDAFVTLFGGTITGVAIGGQSTGLSTAGSFYVPAGQSITLTYSGTPSWTWFGN